MARPGPAGAGPPHRGPGAGGPPGAGPGRGRDQPVPAPGIPDGAPPGQRGGGRGRRRQPVPRLQRRHRRVLDRPRPPSGRRGGGRPGRRPPPLLGQRLLPAIYSEYAAALTATAPMAGPVRAFLTNSGTEAVEGALKLARAATGRQYVVSFYGAFHGRSYGSVSLTASKAKYHAGFGPLLGGVLHAPYGYCHRCPLNLTFPECGHATVDWLEDTLFRYEVDPSEVAAVFVEPVQGEGGYITPPPGWLAKLKALCRRHGILLVADEVQSGMGRTGRMWAIEHSGVEPDVLIAAKGIASGLPLGAFMARDELWRWPKGAHGSTYGGSPVPCAAGLATLAVIDDEGLLANATAQGELLREGLGRLQRRFGCLVEDVRGVGLMLGVEFPTGKLAEEVQLACFRRGLLVLEAGESAVRVSPPLVVTADQCRTALRLFTEAVEEVAVSFPEPDPDASAAEVVGG